MNEPVERTVIYTVKDPYFNDFDVIFSHNAWWAERSKVEALIQAFKIDATIAEACTYAGISVAQWKYFIEWHPDFSAIVEVCRQLPVLKARQAVIKDLDNPDMALKYLERKRKDEFSTKQEIGIYQNDQIEKQLNDAQRTIEQASAIAAELIQGEQPAALVESNPTADRTIDSTPRV